MNAPRRRKSHPTLNPTVNVALILVYVAVAAALLIVTRPSVPVIFPILGVFLGAIGGFLQHIALKRHSNRFGAAKSLLEIRRILTESREGKRYLLYFWAVVIALVLLTFAINKSPLTAASAFAAAYALFAAARETVTLRDLQRE